MIVGPNGAGKTNLLEAIHVGTQGFSPRTRREARVVRFGAGATRVRTEGTTASTVRFQSQVTVTAAGVKRMTLNGASVPGADELQRRFPVLAFTPDRLVVVKGGPLVRRTYLDRTLGRIFPARAALPGDYGRALAQRNAALRRAHGGLSSLEALAPWTEALVALGAALVDARLAAAEELAAPFATAAMSLGLEDAALSYSGSELTLELLAGRLSRDLERGSTGAGPHLDDLAITAGGRELRAFGSQGEQRLAVLALLLAEAKVIENTLGEAPVLLLDDVLSELDDQRRMALLGGVPESCQTLITATSLRSLPARVAPALVIDVVPGQAVKR
jgi:DNA replication and repair protein RecF